MSLYNLSLIDMEKIIILSIHGIGDAVMLTPMIRLLGEKRPDAKISVLTTLTGSKQIFETCPYISEVIKVNRTLRDLRSKLDLFLALRRRNFDVCLTGYSSNFIDNIFAGCIKAKYRIIHWHPMMGVTGLFFIQNTRIDLDTQEHAVEQNLKLLKPINIFPDKNFSPETEIWLTNEDLVRSIKILEQNKITDKDLVIGFHPGSSDEWGMVYKRWSKERFAALGDAILKEYPRAKLLIFGGPNEESLKSEIRSMMTREPVIISDTTLRETAGLIKRCNIFVSNDSGLMHVATAVKTPTVGIFGPTNPLATAPYGKAHITVTETLECRPCWPILKLRKSNFHPKFKHSSPYACLNQLSVSKVFESVEKLLKNNLAEKKLSPVFA
jgi:heptosyltransferase-2